MFQKNSHLTPVFTSFGFVKISPNSSLGSTALWEVTKPTQCYPSTLGSPSAAERCSTAARSQHEVLLPKATAPSLPQALHPSALPFSFTRSKASVWSFLGILQLEKVPPLTRNDFSSTSLPSPGEGTTGRRGRLNTKLSLEEYRNKPAATQCAQRN